MGESAPLRAVTLGKRFGRVRALRDVSFSIGPGITALLGPNGAGKTTLLRIMATTLAPSEGSFEVLGTVPEDAPSRRWVRRRIGYMPQEADPRSSMRLDALLRYIALLKEHDASDVRGEVSRVLGLAELTAHARRRVRALSGGMRRRLMLAQALIGDPRVLILDEPTAGLDPEQRMRFRELVTELAADKAVLLSTHQTEDLPGVSDRVLVIDRGELRFQGELEDLRSLATGRVWVGDQRDPGASHAWRTPDGRYRNLGSALPQGAELVSPTVEEGYLALLGEGAGSPA